MALALPRAGWYHLDWHCQVCEVVPTPDLARGPSMQDAGFGTHTLLTKLFQGAGSDLGLAIPVRP